MMWKFVTGMVAGSLLGMAAAASVMMFAKPEFTQKIIDGGKKLMQHKEQMMGSMMGSTQV